MAYEDRKKLIKGIEKLRGGRKLICIYTFDRGSEPAVSGISISFATDIKEPLFRILKETLKSEDKIDICLYTRGGDANAVWPITSLLREYDENFEILIPFRAHSAGTMFALSAKRIVMSTIGELSPIDPSATHPYNPRDPVKKEVALPISVEDVMAFRDFWKNILEYKKKSNLTIEQKMDLMQPYLMRLSTEVHPLALGIVHRLYTQIRKLARMLLSYNYQKNEITKISNKFLSQFHSHQHMINRQEAREILGKNHVEFADEKLSLALDQLLCQYLDDFELRHPFFLSRFLGTDIEKDGRFIGGAIESEKWSYLFETKAKILQFVKPPDGIQIQVPIGQTIPLLSGLPRQYEIEIIEQGWVRNKNPQGVTV